uniref:Uncharacterized protein n=1 Tax=Anguilla anguilla TaxID=7936 RepID=A0A0E9W0A0_ANGAN
MSLLFMLLWSVFRELK